jgi:hypothetical protein
MSWYDASWPYRRAITLYQSAGTSPNDYTFVIPADLDHVWNNLQASGQDIRITDANGRTLELYDLNSVVASTKTGTVEVDNPAIAINGGLTLFWMYYGNAGAGDAKTVFAPAAALTATLAKDAPKSFIVPVRMERPGALRPANEIAKKASEEIDIFFEFTDILIRRDRTFSGSDRYEEIASCTVNARRANANDTSVIDASKCRFVEQEDRMFFVVRCKAGTDGNDYTIIAVANTVELEFSRVLEARCLVKVRDVDDI